MRKPSPPQNSAHQPNAHDDIRQAVSSLYDRARSQPVAFDDSSAGRSWRLLDEFTIGGARFVIACRTDGDAAAMLTPREREVVALAGTGESNKAIGYQLGISASTVGVLLWRAAAKLGVSSRAELLRAILSCGR